VLDDDASRRPDERMVEETWFSAEARSARAVRTSVRRFLAPVAGVRAVEEIELLAGEVFAEVAAGAQGTGRVCVRVRYADGRLRVEVAEERVPESPPPVLVAREALEPSILDRLLDAFAARWGRTTTAGGESATWFEYLLSIRMPDGDGASGRTPRGNWVAAR
jgi:hypothetical protein